jgi:hypothetical protein
MEYRHLGKSGLMSLVFRSPRDFGLVIWEQEVE